MVDRHSRVHGIANLYVAGSSVFTTSCYANSTLTIVALASRLAAHLATEEIAGRQSVETPVGGQTGGAEGKRATPLLR